MIVTLVVQLFSVLPWDMVDNSIGHHLTYFRLFFVSGQSRQAPDPGVRLHSSSATGTYSKLPAT